MNKTVRDIDLSDSNLLRNCENIFKEPSEKSIPKKGITRSKQKRYSSVNLQKRFMKNNKPTHCKEEIIKQGKVVKKRAANYYRPREHPRVKSR